MTADSTSAGSIVVTVAVASGVGGMLLAAVFLLLVLLTAVVLGARRKIRHLRGPAVKGQCTQSSSICCGIIMTFLWKIMKVYFQP